MMTIRPDPNERLEEPVKFPPMMASFASLTPLEKSLLGHFLLLSRAQTIVEIGVYRAFTTKFLIEFMELNDLPGTVMGFDLPEIVDQLRRENTDVQQWEKSGRLRLIPGELPFSLKKWVETEKPKVDLALVDARHDFPSVDWELKLLWPALAEDGYIVGHDYVGEWDGVRYAFDHFAKKAGAKLIPLRSSVKADAAGHKSVLVAIRRPTYTTHLPDLFFHRWQGLKADLVRGDLTGRIWRVLRKVLRP